MAVAGGKLRIFSSHDLVHWTFEHCHDDLTTECPDLFPLNVDGDPAKRRWVLSGGGRWYMIGDFDGRKFSPRSQQIPFTTAPDLYAGQSFDNAPGGRRIMTHWLFAWRYGHEILADRVKHNLPTSPWAGGSFSVPFELSLRTTRDGERLVQLPVRELETLRQPILSRSNVTLKPGDNLLENVIGPALDIELNARVDDGSTLTLRIAAANEKFFDITYDAAAKALKVDRRHAGMDAVQNFAELIEMPFPPDDAGNLSLRILLDANSAEIVSGNGLTFFPVAIFPDPAKPAMRLSIDRGQCQVQKLDVFAMKSAIE